ncbi:MAG: aminotransferase IV [Phycisphaerae bacterium]|nr:aminotransferase IV [Phycisphaerae bacterium]|tara:strand:- start:9814 stop:10716 length:903 start_codon:yes stop_codon:yes gene_type:complete
MQQRFDERNKDLLVNIDGVLSHRDVAGISPFDSTVQGGDAVWEGLRVYDGRIFRLDEHLDRLRRSAEAVAFETIPDTDSIIEQIRRTLEANGMRDGVHIRLTLSRGLKITSGMDPRLNRAGPTLIVLAEYKAPVYDTSGLSLVTSTIRRFPPHMLDQNIHSCNLLQSIMAKIEANRHGADDALMLDEHGNMAETNATHVFIVKDGQVSTSTTRSCPEGITRSVVLELCEEEGIVHHVRDIPLEEVHGADEVFCTGTMGELAAVTCVDGTVIGDGLVGPTTRRLSESFRGRTEREGVRVVD